MSMGAEDLASNSIDSSAAHVIGRNDRAVYAYPDIVNGNRRCVMDADYPYFMTLENNIERYLFASIEACCQEHGCTAKPTVSPTMRPSANPTLEPTPEPSSKPTIAPSVQLNIESKSRKSSILLESMASSEDGNPLPALPPSATPPVPHEAPSFKTDVTRPSTDPITDLLSVSDELKEDVANAHPTLSPYSSPIEATLPPSQLANNTAVLSSYERLPNAALQITNEAQNDGPNPSSLFYLSLLVPLFLLVILSVVYRKKRKRELAVEQDHLPSEASLSDAPSMLSDVHEEGEVVSEGTPNDKSFESTTISAEATEVVNKKSTMTSNSSNEENDSGKSLYCEEGHSSEIDVEVDGSTPAEDAAACAHSVDNVMLVTESEDLQADPSQRMVGGETRTGRQLSRATTDSAVGLEAESGSGSSEDGTGPSPWERKEARPGGSRVDKSRRPHRRRCQPSKCELPGGSKRSTRRSSRNDRYLKAYYSMDQSLMDTNESQSMVTSEEDDRLAPLPEGTFTGSDNDEESEVSDAGFSCGIGF